MKISGKAVAEKILQKLEIKIKREKLNPHLAIILAGDDPSSGIYVNNKIKAAQKANIKAELYEFRENEKEKCLKKIAELNKDNNVNGIIVQFPTFKDWNFEEFENSIKPEKDVDGFLDESPYIEATAMAVWEMLLAFAITEGFKEVEDFLKGKGVVVLGKGKTAGGPIIKLLGKKGIDLSVIDKETKNPDSILKKADVIISATGVKNIVNGSNIKKGAYVIGVGVGKEIIDGKAKTFGDINEEEVAQIARLYCPTIGGIGPLTIVSLLKNVVESALRSM